MLKESINEKLLFIILLIVFIITEIIDHLLDHFLGNSILHSILQLFLFASLFLVTYKMFITYLNKKVEKLIPEELMNILKIISDSNQKGIIINQRKMGELLNITKPTIKKRINTLLSLEYIFFEKKGNNRYFRITNLGKSFIC